MSLFELAGIALAWSTLIVPVAIMYAAEQQRLRNISEEAEQRKLYKELMEGGDR